MIAYIYELSETANNKVNHDKLYIELKVSTIPKVISSEGIKGKIYLFLEEVITNEQELELNAIIASHDGEDAIAFEERDIAARELIIRELNQLAIYHPLLDNIKTVNYLTSIDNWVNAYVRSGINDVLIAKIAYDAGDTGSEHFPYLHTIVNESR